MSHCTERYRSEEISPPGWWFYVETLVKIEGKIGSRRKCKLPLRNCSAVLMCRNLCRRHGRLPISNIKRWDKTSKVLQIAVFSEDLLSDNFSHWWLSFIHLQYEPAVSCWETWQMVWLDSVRGPLLLLERLASICLSFFSFPMPSYLFFMSNH